MRDEKVRENQKPNDELSNESLKKAQGGAFNGFVNFFGRRFVSLFL
jgi:hypothetical protein